jgi:hypothetical protein
MMDRIAAMDFASSDPLVVKSVKQLDFLNTWMRLHARRASLARRADYTQDRLDDEKADMVFFRVEWCEGLPRIRIDS